MTRRIKYKAFLYFYQNGHCAYCLKQMRLSFEREETGGNWATLDHIKPISKRGKTSWDNLVLCCSSCNHNKGDKNIKPIFPPLKRINFSNKEVDENGNDIKTYRGLGSQIFKTNFMREIASRIYRATNSYSLNTASTYPVDMIQSTVSQPQLRKRGA